MKCQQTADFSLGDMQLTKTEIMQTQMLVTTPEKWDVVTRKPGDVSLSQLVRYVNKQLIFKMSTNS